MDDRSSLFGNHKLFRLQEAESDVFVTENARPPFFRDGDASLGNAGANVNRLTSLNLRTDT